MIDKRQFPIGTASRRRYRHRIPALKGRSRRAHSAFTLFELILAIALSVALLALIGTAINLYLLRVDASRTRVEEAQLARSILTKIADDIRATAIYKPQDTSTVASLVASSAEFDADSIDEENPGAGGGSGSASGGGGGPSGPTSPSSPSSPTTPGGSSLAGNSSTGGSASELIMPLGVNGTLSELYVDVERLPRLEELFLTNTGYTNTNPIPTPVGAPFTAPPRPSNVKTVRYFIRQGRPLEPGSAAASSLDPQAQLDAGGLVRQEIDRPTRVFAETMGNQAVLESGQTLLAPEVVHIEFRFFNGSQVIDYWDMTEMGSLPPAIEVRIWLPANNGEQAAAVTPLDLTATLAGAHEYRQIVFLPMSQVGGAGASGMGAGSSGTSGASSSMSGTSSSSSTSGSGSTSGFSQ